MATETTETAGTATTASANTEPLTTTRAVYDAGKEAALAKVAAIRAEKTQAGQQSAGNAGEPAGAQSGEQVSQDAGQEQAQTAEAGAVAAETTQETTAAEPSDEDKAAQVLLAAARENRVLIEHRRRLSQRENELAEREKKLTTAVVPERETVGRLTKARESGDPIEVLRAAGYSDKDVGNFALELINRMGSLEGDSEEKTPPKAPTAEEVAALVRKQTEDEAKARVERENAERQALFTQQRNQYFAGIGAEFKTNAKDYPVLSAIRPSHAQLESAFVEHFQRTGERLTPPQLLASLEKEYSGRGITIAPKKPAAVTKVATATSKTIGQGAASDAVTVRDDSAAAKKPKDIHELNEEGRRAAIAEIERRRAAKKTARV